MAFLTLVFIAAGLYSSYNLWSATFWETGVTADSYVAEQNTFLDVYGPDELTMLWGEFRQGSLRTRIPPQFHLMNQMHEELHLVARRSAMVAGIALLAMFGVWVTTLAARKQTT